MSSAAAAAAACAATAAAAREPSLPERAAAVAAAVAAERLPMQHLATDPKWPKWARTLNEGLNGGVSEVRAEGLHPARGALTATILAGQAETGRTGVRYVTIARMKANPIGFQRLMDALVVYCPYLTGITFSDKVDDAVKLASTFSRVISLDTALPRALTHVGMHNTGTSNADVTMMAVALGVHCPNLLRFSVTGSEMTNAGVAAIATHLLRPGSKLTQLELQDNRNIGDVGMRALACAFAHDATSIRTLNLGDNLAITDRGMAALAYALLDSSTFVDIALPPAGGGVYRGDAAFVLLASVNYACTGGIYSHTSNLVFAANRRSKDALLRIVGSEDAHRQNTMVDERLREGVAFDVNNSTVRNAFRRAILRGNLPLVRVLFDRLATRDFETLAHAWISRFARVDSRADMPAVRIDELRSLVSHRATTRMCAVIFCHEATRRATREEEAAAVAAYGVPPPTSTVARVVAAPPRCRMLSPTLQERVTVVTATEVTTAVEVRRVVGLAAVPLDMLRHGILPLLARANCATAAQRARRAALVARQTAISLDRDLCAEEAGAAAGAAGGAAAASPLKRARHE